MRQLGWQQSEDDATKLLEKYYLLVEGSFRRRQ